MKKIFEKNDRLAMATGLMMAILFSGCKNPREEPTPEPKPVPVPEEKEEEPTTSKVTITAELYNLVNGELVPVLENRAGEEAPGTIIGIGDYNHGDKVTIKAEINDFMSDKLVALYEKEGKGGFTKERGGAVDSTADNPLYTIRDGVSSEVSFDAKEDMTFIAVFEEYQQPPLEISNIYGHDYWLTKNKEATDYIKPRAKKYNSRYDAIYWTGFCYMHPNLDATVVSHTIYQNSPTIFNLDGAPYDPPYHIRDGDFNKAYRFTYALTTLDGEIVEIFPPSYSVSGGNFPQLNYITAPEGSYRVRLLVNFPNDREVWHIIPMMSSFTKADEYYGKEYGWKHPEALPPHQNWYKDGDIIHVKNRANNGIATPVWDDTKIELIGEVAKSSDVNLTITITNITNRRMEGTIFITEGYDKWWHEEGKGLMDMRMQKVWTQEKEEKHPYDSWERDRGEQKVKLLPNEKMTIEFQLRNRSYARENWSDPGWGSDYEHLGISGDSGLHTIFYWQSKNGKREFMVKGNSQELAIMEERDWGSLQSRKIAFWFDSLYGFNKKDCVFSLLCPTIEEREEGIRNMSFCRNCIIFDQ